MAKQKLDKQKALELYNVGLNDAQLAKKLGLSRNTVLTWRLQAGLQANDSRRREPFDKDEARKLVEAGLSDSAVARKLGVSWRLITNWRRQNGIERNAE